MTEKMLESTRTGATRRSSYLASIYDKDYLELESQVIVQGGSSRTRQKTTTPPSCVGYSKEANNKDACIAKSAKLSTLHLLLDSSSHGNSHQSSDQNSCLVDLLFSKSKSNCSKESNLTCLSSKKQYLPNSSAPFKNPSRIMDSSQTSAAASNSLIQNLGKANDSSFSNDLRPSSVLIAKSTNYNVKTATLPTNNAVLARVNETIVTEVAEAEAEAATDDNSAVIDSSRGTSAHIVGIQGKNPLIPETSNPVLSFVARSKESIHNSVLREKRKADTNFCNEALVESSSICSLGASNNFDTCSRKQEETDDVSTRLGDDDNDEETEDSVVEKDAPEGTRVKRSRNAETRNLSERKRRDKINKKMRVLKDLVPNCNKGDKASMLDDAIEYLKTLKLQLQIMSMGAGVCMPLMMLPTASHHMINTLPHLPHLMRSGMGFRPGGTGIPPCNLPHFPIPPLPAAGITDINRVRMFGLPNNQLLPIMPMMSHSPFIPMVGKPSTQSLLQPTSSTTATNLAENL